MNEVSDDPKQIPYIIEGEKQLFHGKWLAAKQIDFVNRKTGHKGIWQIAYRTTTPAGANVDGVSVITTLTKNDKKYFVFVKQYRLPVMAYSLEFPAGLLDVGETSTDAAIRELKEETGYTVSKVVYATDGVQSLDPGLSNDSVNFVVVEIDGDSPDNCNPVQILDASEDIDVILVPCDEALEKLREFTAEGIYVEAMVYSFVLGYSMHSHQGCVVKNV